MRRYNYFSVRDREKFTTCAEVLSWYKADEVDKKRKKDEKEIKRLKDENAVLSDECIRDTKTIARLKKEKEWLLDNMVYEKEDRQWVENKMQQALKEK